MDDSLKKIACRFFEGSTSLEEERKLYSMIVSSDELTSQFKNLEMEWKKTHVPSAKTLASLDSLKNKMEGSSRKKRRAIVWSTATAAVAACAALFWGFISVVQSAVTDHSQIQTFTVEAPIGTQSKVSLPDGSIVWLNSGSRLSYDSTFNTDNRNVSLEGEGCFDVTHNKALPLVVSVGDCRFKVLGTRFDISAYKEDDFLRVALIEGSLQVSSSSAVEVMSKGDVISVAPETGTLTKCGEDASQFASWTEGAIRYDNISVSELMRRLERGYNVEIILENDAFSDHRLRVSFSGEDSIDDVLKAVGEIIPASVVKVGRTFYLVEREN